MFNFLFRTSYRCEKNPTGDLDREINKYLIFNPIF